MTDSSSIRDVSSRTLDGLRTLLPLRFQRDRPIVPVVRLTGIIGFSTPLRPGLTLAGLTRTLDRAFAVRQAPAVALTVNSPGGSPVQSHLIFCRIRQLAARESGGRPSAGMRPREMSREGHEIAPAVTVLIIEAEPQHSTQLFRHQYVKTQDPNERYDKMLEIYPIRVNPGWALWSSARAVKS